MYLGGKPVFRRAHALAVSILTLFGVTASVGLAVFVTAGPAAAYITDDCPATIPPSTMVDNQVGALMSASGGTETYTFSSFVNLSPKDGVPGLIEYCVFTNTPPDSHDVNVPLLGADGTQWINSSKSSYFGFLRPTGNPTNIPLDGITGITMGSATWNSGTPPTDQIIVLHINDSAVCSGSPTVQSDGTCFVFPGTQSVPQNEDLTVSKTATPSFTRTYKWSITKDVDQTEVKVAPGGTGTFNYTVSVTHDDGTDSGWEVDGTITVANPNSIDFTGVNVTDSGGGGTCSVTDANGGVNETIPANSSVDFPYSCTYTSNPGSVTDTATASWDKAAENTPHDSATGMATADFSKVSPKIADGTVEVSDSQAGDLGSADYTQQNPITFSYSKTFGGVPGTCTEHDNTATFATNTTGTEQSAAQAVDVCVGADLQVSKTANPAFTRTFTWNIEKLVDNTEIDIAQGGSATFNYTVNVSHDAGTDSNWGVSGTITVTNPNDWEAITADVTDSIDNGGNCSVANGVGVSIPAGKSADLQYTCTYAKAPSPLTGGTNTATATWDQAASFTSKGSATGTAAVDFTTPTTIVDGSVAVTDSLGGTLGIVKYTDPSPIPFTYSHKFSGDPAGTCTTHDNTATFTTSDTGTTGGASQGVKVCVGADLTVSKTAMPSFTRTYIWKINKSADKTQIDPGGTVNYTVTATETGFNDSNWHVSGYITVYNPNDWEAITAKTITDAINNGGSCAVTGGTGVPILAATSVQLPYSCTYNSKPSPLTGGTNTATAAWDAGTYFTPDGTAAGTAGVDFSTPTATVDKTITVTDSQAGTLGTATATDVAPFTTKMFMYSKKFSPPASGCTTVSNTATISETGQTSSQSVQDCNSAALTMGFWQNKNGQGIITSGASTSGVCNSGTWLRQFAPFKDLSSTANCTAVATYVTNIIKAANASGASMNAMLKAQMLATSLDVYFSDSSLGGNRISAPAPIGGLTIDLSHICHMLDSSSGGTCSGTFENVSSAFGGATSMTVSAMLTFAASQSNSGGGTWYGNVKATQQLAKDAFDAINNQVVISP